MILTKITGLFGSKKDTHRPKTIEKALRQSEESLALALSVSQSGTWQLHLSTNQISWSAEQFRLFGYEPGRCESTVENWLRVIHPADRSRVSAHLQQVLQQQTHFNMEYRIQWPDGTMRWLTGMSQISFNEQGNPTHIIGIQLDITDRKAVIEALEASEAQLSSMLEHTPNFILKVDQGGTILYINRVGSGFAREEVLGTNLNDYVSLETRSVQQDALDRVFLQAEASCFESTGVGPDNTTAHYEVRLAPIVQHGQVAAAIVIYTDISEYKRVELALQSSQQFVQSIADSSPNILYIFDLAERRNLYINREISALLGYTPSEIRTVGSEIYQELLHPADRKRMTQHLEAIANAADGDVLEFEYRLWHRKGEWRWFHSHDTVFKRHSDDRVNQYIGSAQEITARKRAEEERQQLNQELELRVKQRTAALKEINVRLQQEITERKQAEAKLIHDALHDALTGLPNRVLFMDRVELSLKRARRTKAFLFAILFIDLDRFKVINDSLGHLAGDQLLMAVAKLLNQCVRGTDTVARLGGDEFTILLDDIQDITDATIIANRIQEELQTPFELNGHRIFSGASIGIVIGNADYEQGEDLIRDADIALYRAKDNGRARYEIFDRAMYEKAFQRLQIESDLQHALSQQEFLVYYQPIMSVDKQRLMGFEALIRWQHPSRGVISAQEFIPIAEDTGLMIPMGRWILREACRQCKVWQRLYPTMEGNWQISVNVSSQQFRDPNLVKQIDQILRETELDGSYLKLEITESMLIENADLATDILLQLRARNIELSLDDFGTGYSSLSYLHRFPVNTLKIDRSFVHCMNPEVEGSEIVQAIVNLSHTLGIKVVAEGVETAHQFSQLRSCGCDFVQGYLFSEPLGPQAAEAMLESVSV